MKNHIEATYSKYACSVKVIQLFKQLLFSSFLLNFSHCLPDTPMLSSGWHLCMAFKKIKFQTSRPVSSLPINTWHVFSILEKKKKKFKAKTLMGIAEAGFMSWFCVSLHSLIHSVLLHTHTHTFSDLAANISAIRPPAYFESGTSQPNTLNICL